MCPHLHPFHDKAKAKFGVPQIAWQALTATLPKRPKKYNKKGKAYSMVKIGDMHQAEIDELTESEPDQIMISSDDEHDTQDSYPVINLISEAD